MWAECDNSVYDRSIRPVQNLRKREWTTAAIDFKLYCGQENRNALLTSMGMVGQVIGSIGGGVYSDKFGRKNAIIVSERLQTQSLQMFFTNIILFIGLTTRSTLVLQ